ncbi:MAG: hypothetical protein AB7N76_15445 [Planctomycetota bacterium]
MRIDLKARAGPSRCVYCRDELSGARWRCPGCSAELHAECAAELVTCPSAGCGQGTVRRVANARQQQLQQQPVDESCEAKCAKVGFTLVVLFALGIWGAFGGSPRRPRSASRPSPARRAALPSSLPSDPEQLARLAASNARTQPVTRLLAVERLNELTLSGDLQALVALAATTGLHDEVGAHARQLLHAGRPQLYDLQGALSELHTKRVAALCRASEDAQLWTEHRALFVGLFLHALDPEAGFPRGEREAVLRRLGQRPNELYTDEREALAERLAELAAPEQGEGHRVWPTADAMTLSSAVLRALEVRVRDVPQSRRAAAAALHEPAAGHRLAKTLLEQLSNDADPRVVRAAREAPSPLR